jgi:hypothetical protein
MKVSKFQLNEAEFKKQYKQILGFHYVSCMNNTGIEELTNQLVTVALKEKYMGELIPVRILISKVKIYFY